MDRVNPLSHQREPGRELRSAIVIGTTETACTVIAQGRTTVVPYAIVFPEPRTERVAPGHLVAIAKADNGSDFVIWRWYDAVVLNTTGGLINLWEPGHGTVSAHPRDPQQPYAPGVRAYLSAGLPGAQWWVAGLALDLAEDALVEMDEVARLFTENDLWAELA
jgi:hypothetical protein